MLSASSAFTSAVNAGHRNMKALAIVDFATQIAYPFATATATTVQSGYDASNLCNGRFRLSDECYIGPNFSGLDTPQVGWRSTAVGDAFGTIAPQVITVTYNASIRASKFWVVGLPGYYAVDFKIENFVSGPTWETLATVTGNTNWMYVLSTTPKTVTQLRITITKVAPGNSQARLVQCGAISTVVFEDQDLVELHLLEETGADTEHPFGNVTANTCTLSIRNDSRWFAPTNAESPWFDLLRPRLRVKPYIGVVVDSALSKSEMMPRGVFWTGDWQAKSSDIVATTTAYDKLFDIANLDVPQLRVLRNTTGDVLYKQLFDALGITDVAIEILNSVPYGWVPSGKVMSALQALGLAFNAYTYTDPVGKIRVKKFPKGQSSVATWDDTNQIFTVDNPQSTLTTYSQYIIKYLQPTISKEDQLLTVTSLTVPTTGTTLKRLQFSNGPAVHVTQVDLVGAKTAVIDYCDYGAWDITVGIKGGTVEEQVGLVVKGYKVDGPNASEGSVDPTTIPSGTWGEPPLTVESNLIQTKDGATSYGSNISTLFGDPQAYFTLTVRGDPSIELFDQVMISSDTDKIPGTKVALTRIETAYDGGLSCNITARKAVNPL